MENIVTNIKDGGIDGFTKARKIADENQAKTRNVTLVQRVVDYVDQFRGRDREHFSFDVIEIVKV